MNNLLSSTARSAESRISSTSIHRSRACAEPANSRHGWKSAMSSPISPAKGRYRPSLPPHHRLTAVLRVLHVLPSHAAAAQWFRDRNLPLPSNCHVVGNPPEPFDCSHRIYNSSSCLGAARTHREWDASYRVRAIKHPTFVICSPHFRNLSWDAPVVEDQQLRQVFGGIPGTQNPGRLAMDMLSQLLQVLGLAACIDR